MPSITAHLKQAKRRRQTKKFIEKTKQMPTLEERIRKRTKETNHLHPNERRFLERVLMIVNDYRARGATEEEITTHLRTTYNNYPVLREILEKKPARSERFVKVLKEFGLEKINPAKLTPDGISAWKQLIKMHSSLTNSYDRNIEKHLIKRIKNGQVK